MSQNHMLLLQDIASGTPSGNYDGSSADFDSDGVKAVGYYQGQGSIQTMGIRTTDFVGIITLQATIDNEWQTADWFDIYQYGDGSTALSDYRSHTATGNFCWVRAKVTEFDSGTINFVNITY